MGIGNENEDVRGKVEGTDSWVLVGLLDVVDGGGVVIMAGDDTVFEEDEVETDNELVAEEDTDPLTPTTYEYVNWDDMIKKG